MLKQLWSMFQAHTGIATDQLAVSLQEIPSSNAMEMGQVMRSVSHEKRCASTPCTRKVEAPNDRIHQQLPRIDP